jgi:hypothetical protein
MESPEKIKENQFNLESCPINNLAFVRQLPCASTLAVEETLLGRARVPARREGVPKASGAFSVLD